MAMTLKTIKDRNKVLCRLLDLIEFLGIKSANDDVMQAAPCNGHYIDDYILRHHKYGADDEQV